MLVSSKNYKSLDYTKYKRVFIFGCSFTNYFWPTWANIITFETPQAEIFNFGQPGGGNLFISERVVAANTKYRFNEEDLVLIMWSTFFREDRYIKNGWNTPGNIYSQDFYDDKFIEKYTCVKGFVVRDLALISLVKNLLENTASDSFILRSVDVEYQNENIYFPEYNMDKLVDLYKDLFKDMSQPMSDFVKNPERIINNYETSRPLCNSQGWYVGHEYFVEEKFFKKRLLYDYHPNPKMYLEFLLNIGFNLSKETQEKVLNLNKQLLSFTEDKQIEKWFSGLCEEMKNYHRYVTLF